MIGEKAVYRFHIDQDAGFSIDDDSARVFHTIQEHCDHLFTNVTDSSCKVEEGIGPVSA
jgi:hypothetical protein